MATSLYLDTARLGPISPRAQRASIAFARLAAKEGCSAHFEDFLYQGIEAWPAFLRERYRGLSDWHGIKGLKDSLRTLVKTLPDLPVLLANRSSQLMRLAARLLFHRCRNVLVTDLEWPAYRLILEQQQQRFGKNLKELPLRATVLFDRPSLEELVAKVTACYFEHQCDGLFLSSVTYDGFRLPVREIARSLAIARRLPFMVVDGSQEFCHAPVDLDGAYCDFYIAGCHKWLRAYHPMGLGFCGRPSEQRFVTGICNHMMEEGSLDDPLLRFTAKWERGTEDAFSETVSLSPLFPCAAAIAEFREQIVCPEKRFAQLVQSTQRMEAICRSTSWAPLVPHSSMRSGILLVQDTRPEITRASAESLRCQFQMRGLALTAYGNGILRLSAPTRPWCSAFSTLLRAALAQFEGSIG